jgi:hypothetical protein
MIVSKWQPNRASTGLGFAKVVRGASCQVRLRQRYAAWLASEKQLLLRYSPLTPC